MTADKPSHLVPNLRFPEFRDASEWEPRTLGQIGEFIGGGTPSTAIPEYWGGDIQWFTPSEVNKRYLSKSIRTITGEGLKHSSARLLPAGALLITTRATIGDVGIVDSACATNQGFQSLVVFGHEVNLFWYYWFVKHKAELIKRSSGSTFLEIGKAELKQIPTVRPNKGEQQKIANCLGSLDELITAEERKLEALRQHKQGLMQQLFPRPGETVPRLRFPEFRDSSGWKTGRCRDIANVLPGYGFPDRFQGNKMGQFPFYKVSDISRTIEERKNVISEARNYIESDVLDEIRGKPVPAGTIIFAKIGEAIRSNRRVITTKPAVIDNNTAGVKAIEIKCSDEFLFYLWSNVSLIDHAGGVVPAVSKSALENVPLCYPNDPEEQHRIADCLGPLDDLIEAEGRMLDVLRHYKQGLMQQLFPSPEAEPR
ncbi:MAG: restriction endonuclease subunit S [Boseongicola sp. SB0675_bin_26]|nr:restriction endonuclease subunit S [Boseongicola sp. SB0675_bin_26]